jgi:hypothetical protein
LEQKVISHKKYLMKGMKRLKNSKRIVWYKEHYLEQQFDAYETSRK